MRNFTRIILLNLAMIMCLSVAGCTMVKEDTSSTPTAEIPTQSAVIDPTVTPDASTSTPTAVV